MLNTTQAEADVLALLDDMATRDDQTAADAQQTRRDYARQLVAIMATLVRSGTVTGTVNTTGTAAAQAGPLTNGKIS